MRFQLTVRSTCGATADFGICRAMTTTGQTAFRITPTMAKWTARLLRCRRSEEHTSELQSPCNLVCRLLLEKKKYKHLTSHLDCNLIQAGHYYQHHDSVKRVHLLQVGRIARAVDLLDPVTLPRHLAIPSGHG